MSLANRMASLRLFEWAWALDGKNGGLLCRSLATILDRGGSDLDIALQVLGEWLVGKSDLLAHALISSVFARGLDRNSVITACELIAVIVFTVPDYLVFAGRPGRTRHGKEYIFLL